MHPQHSTSCFSCPAQRTMPSRTSRSGRTLESRIALRNQADRAESAWILLDGRDGIVNPDHQRAYALVSDQEYADCCHCQGVLARCLMGGYGCIRDVRQGVHLARKSADAGSMYGQYIYAYYLEFRTKDPDPYQAKELYKKATDQGLDFAHIMKKQAHAPSTPACDHTAPPPAPKHSSCPHGRRKSICRECKGGGICKHSLQRRWCKVCKPPGSGGARCEHGKQTSRCVKCKGSGVCEHSRLKHRCKQCKQCK